MTVSRLAGLVACTLVIGGAGYVGVSLLAPAVTPTQVADSQRGREITTGSPVGGGGRVPGRGPVRTRGGGSQSGGGVGGGGGGQVGSLTWFCDWRFGTGSGTDWNFFRGTASTGEGMVECYHERTQNGTVWAVVARASLGECPDFPETMDNVLRLKMEDTPSPSTDSGNMVSAWNPTDTLEVGQYKYRRTYVCFAVPVGTTELNKHWSHDGTGSISGHTCTGINGCYSGRWFINGSTVQSDSTFCMGYGVMFNQPNLGRGQGEFGYCGHKTHTVRVYENMQHRFHLDSARFGVRISDVNGNVLATSGDFNCSTGEAGGCVDSGGYQLDSIGEYAVLLNDSWRTRGHEVGHNGGRSNFPGSSGPYYYYVGGDAVRISLSADDWIGATYPVGPEVN